METGEPSLARRSRTWSSRASRRKQYLEATEKIIMNNGEATDKRHNNQVQKEDMV